MTVTGMFLLRFDATAHALEVGRQLSTTAWQQEKLLHFVPFSPLQLMVLSDTNYAARGAS